MNRRGFSLLEVMVALAILGLFLAMVLDINNRAIQSHLFTKQLTVANLLARSKMTDLEQKLYDEGLPADDDEESGDFDSEGWPSFKWRAKIIAPKTQGVSPEQLIGAIFNLPTGAEGIASMFGGGESKGGPTADAASAMGPLGGLLQGQFTQMVDQLAKSVREVHLTVSWQEDERTESVDVVTHVVSLGPGSDRNGAALTAGGQMHLQPQSPVPVKGVP